MNATEPLVDIVCSVHDGARYLAAFLESVAAQTHGGWRLWLRDDGSRDDSAAIIRDWCARDYRIRLLPGDGASLGVVGAYDWLLQRAPEGAAYIMFADQDDVWLPPKIAVTLRAMREAEASRGGGGGGGGGGAVLVHTDLTVANADLSRLGGSFWAFARIHPDRATFRRVVVRNVVTGATAMMNRELREKVGAIPEMAAMHDWWVACVAARFGRIVAVPESTVLYRQHGTNNIGARRPSSALALGSVPAAIPGAFARTGHVRVWIAAAARQAAALLLRYRNELPENEREFLAAYARIPQQSWLPRKFDILRLHLQSEDGFVQNAGVLLRG